MHKTFAFQLLPNARQEAVLSATLEATRLLYNEALEELIGHYKSTGKHLSRFSQDKLHNKARHPHIPAVLVDTTIARLHTSFGAFFQRLRKGDKSGFPRFKGYLRWHSLQFRDAQQHLKDGYLYVPHALGRKIKVNQHRAIEGEFLYARIVRKPSGWYVHAVCEVEERPLPQSDAVVGLDFGLKAIVADSNGNVTVNPRHLKKSLAKLGRLQRSACKKRLGSKRRRKANILVAKHHERIANQRRDYLHKLARKYVNEYGTIVVEDLNVAGMSTHPTLARSIHDASWGMLRTLLTEKAESAGRQLIAVAPQYTSQKCSACGAHVQKSLSVRTHSCGACGYNADRDVNAAKNILRLGLSLRGGVA